MARKKTQTSSHWQKDKKNFSTPNLKRVSKSAGHTPSQNSHRSFQKARPSRRKTATGRLLQALIEGEDCSSDDSLDESNTPELGTNKKSKSADQTPSQGTHTPSRFRASQSNSSQARAHNTNTQICDSVDEKLNGISDMLSTVVERLDKLESEKKSESSRSRSALKRPISNTVRREMRVTYKSLLEVEDDVFTGYDTTAETTFKHPTNEAVTDMLVNEVHKHNPTFSTADIRSAAYTYYTSLRQKESLKRRGKDEQRRLERRRRERVCRRLTEREAQFQRMSYSSVDRAKWSKVLVSELISSDESDVEEEKPVLVVNELGWRSEKVSKFFAKLDQALTDRKSEQARRQTKCRIRIGNKSNRKMPSKLSAWMVQGTKKQ